MNIRVNTIGGGVFSKFMIAMYTVIRSVDNVDDITKVYIDDRGRKNKPNLHAEKNSIVNLFDSVLEQTKEEEFDKVVTTTGQHTYTDISNHEDYDRLRKVCSKVRVSRDIYDRVLPSIGRGTLGVHVRLTDMSHVHPKYGTGSSARYVEKMEDITGRNTYDNIFVASDNNQSLQVIQARFDILFNDVSNRCKKEKEGENYYKYLVANLRNETVWGDSFLEMLSLAACGELLYKMSDLSNAALLFSNSIREVHRV